MEDLDQFQSFTSPLQSTDICRFDIASGVIKEIEKELSNKGLDTSLVLETIAEAKEKSIEIPTTTIQTIDGVGASESCVNNIQQIPIEDSIDDPVLVYRDPLLELNQREPSNSLDKHLIYPKPIMTRSRRNNNNLGRIPSAISSSGWRNILEEKENKKRIMKENILIRKEDRLKKKREKLFNQKKKQLLKRKLKDKKKNRLVCSVCNENICSDGEEGDVEDAESTINLRDCDKCPNWYHINCTPLCNIDIVDAIVEEYTCDSCKECIL